ncbi:SusD/RagB family nutrient-binding outer membrane lipoprotein [Chryseobacterium jejuense]|uniref:Susd and RagB outer membrane lipoprotein n=1 Tax=Chryseobacterium jejuense TaxID=445960 RepID=A0A2X2VUA5_CHRJE|nr:SusD/RagB family nutrient-binding outer membrane lipoprotein [Chryseobacterium jejuense]SDI96232.1 Susd and RagB outer membrane lipoprotein [Chryseobacterium jejuense]SQB27145.1 Susd and RagB outer membrane lipoprotein [Chryseobacterium jejuense]
MKNIIISSLLALVLTSCTSDNVNDDPHVAYSMVPEPLLTYAEKELSDYMTTPSVNENNFRLTMQYWQEVTYVSESNYNFTARNVSNTIWTDNYVNVLNNLNKAKELIEQFQPTASEVNAWPAKRQNQLAIIDILSVYTFQTMVDTFGDVPYSQALNYEKYPLPIYDDDTQIYEKLITRLQADINSLEEGEGSFGSGDIFYQGDIGKWEKFGNSLLLKLGIALSDVNPSLAQSTINAAITGGVITNETDNANFRYQAETPNFNPLFENLANSGRNDFFGGKPFIDFLNTTSDPRRTQYFHDVHGQYIGQVIGLSGVFTDFSAPGLFAYIPVTPGKIMTHTEVAFYMAEAAARFGIGGSPDALYQNAVQASFLEWGFSAQDAQSYLSNNPYDATNWKKSIGEQAWVAMYNHPVISWNFYRRLDYPVLQAPPTAIANAGGKVPVRLQYPTLEATTNGTNYAKAAAAIGGDKLTTKVFWDVQ